MLTALGNLCSAAAQLPTSDVISTGLEKCEDIAVQSGGFADTWRGDLRGDRVCIKTLRIYPSQNLQRLKNVSIRSVCQSCAHERHLQIFCKRAVMWRRLSHPNILPFLGINTTLSDISLVYDWGCGGNLIQYLDSNPQADRLSLVCRIPVDVETEDVFLDLTLFSSHVIYSCSTLRRGWNTCTV